MVYVRSVSPDSKSAWVLVVIALSSIFACGKTADVGPPEQVVVRVDSFDGQNFVGRLTLRMRAAARCLRTASSRSTLVAGHESCSGWMDVQKSQFVLDKDNPVYTTMQWRSRPAPCLGPAPGGPPTSMRVEFETPDGVRIVRAQGDGGRGLGGQPTGQVQRGPRPRSDSERDAASRECGRLAAAKETPAQVACPRDVRKGAVTRVVQDHLLQIARRAPGANDDPYQGGRAIRRTSGLRGGLPSA